MNPSPETCKRLTEYIGEKYIPQWWCAGCSKHIEPSEVTFGETHDPRSGGCGGWVSPSRHGRPFTTTDDLFAVYGEIYAEGKWGEFRLYADCQRIKQAFGKVGIEELAVWLFCLNAPDQIGERMEMVGEWIKEKGK